MNLFGMIGGPSPPSTASIPLFEQGEKKDSTDLQIRSLVYLYKRLRICKLASFLKDGRLKYVDGEEDEDNLYFKKLDVLYNTEGFKKKLVEENYRITIDFTKNKFRSFCILSEYPSESLTRPSSPVKGQSVNEEFSEGYPVLKDHKEKKSKGFKFVYLPLQIRMNDLISILANSDIYIEHFSMFSLEERYTKAFKAVKLVIDSDRYDNDKVVNLTLDEKELIIRNYLTSVAFAIQVKRIYLEYMKNALKSNESNKEPASPKKLSSKPSISNISSTSPIKLSSKPSITNLSNDLNKLSVGATPKLKSKPSISKLKLEELYNPVAAPPKSPTKSRPSRPSSPTKSPTKSSSKSTSKSASKTSSEASSSSVDSDLMKKCEWAVSDKLAKESVKLQPIVCQGPRET